jgi:hypothetical protein
MLAIRDVVKKGDSGRPAEHAEDSIDLSGENRALGQFLASQPSFVNLNRPGQLDVGQHLCLHKETARLSDQLKILDDLIPISDYVLRESGPHVVDPQVYGNVE